MSPEEQAKLEAEQAEAQAKADAEAKDDETPEGNEPNEESKQLEAELKREREAREKAEKATAEYAFKLRDKKRKEPDEEDNSDEEKPLTAKSLQSILAQEREATRKEMQSAEAERLAGKVSNSDTEKQLILEIRKNRSFPAHLSLEEQIEECYILANKKKILGENNELKRALRGKSGVSNDASSTHQDAPTGNQPKMAPVEATELARFGFTWNSTSRQYEKKLSNGSTLVRDSKTKQTRLVKA